MNVHDNATICSTTGGHEAAPGLRALPLGRALLAAFVGLATTVACSDDATVPSLEGGLALDTVVEGLDGPVYLTYPPGDTRRLFILEKPGRVRVVLDGALLAEPFLDLESETSSNGERGLLGLAFHPQYAANGDFFVHHTDLDGDTRILRYTAASDDVADPASAELVLAVEQPFSNHNGGQIAFGPDGLLYIGLGDGGSAGDPQGNGQDPSTLLGSILRIDPDGGTPYAIPPDNPFASSADEAPEIWAYGLRNPWRFSFDRATGDVYIGDVGQGAREEIDFQPASSAGEENYGWNVLEGTRCFATDPCDATGTVLPVHEYDHADGCSVTGGYVYRGASLPDLEGRYLFGDFCSGWVRSFRLVDGAATDIAEHTPDLGVVSGLTSFGEDAAGEVYLLSIEGGVYRLVGSD